MNSKYLLKTPFGQLKFEINTSNFTETRTIDFEKDALIISGLNIATIEYQLEKEANLPSNVVRSFEKYLPYSLTVSIN